MSAAALAAVPIDLAGSLDDPARLCLLPDADFDAIPRTDIAAFQLAAAQRLLARQAERIPAVAAQLAGRDPADFATLDDFIVTFFDEDAYKTYDPDLLRRNDYAGMTEWIARYSSEDLSGIDMEGCASLTEWCERLERQADLFVCHSSGTSGTLSFIPRSRRDRDMVVDFMVFRNQPLFTPFERNDVTFFALSARRVYRITQALYDGLEQRHHCNPAQLLPCFHSPEFHIAQGRLRKAAADGTMEQTLRDPIVAAHREEVESFHRELPELTRRWTEKLIARFRGKKIYFQGSFDRAWQITRHFEDAGLSGVFAPESVFALVGGVKDGTVLPHDWLDRFKLVMGVGEDSLASTWGMSEITGGVPRCSHGQYHFSVTIIPFLLEPRTRNPLPRNGMQTGQIALLELNSRDCWGGFISGDRGTIDWDSGCTCGRPGPSLASASIGRL